MTVNLLYLGGKRLLTKRYLFYHAWPTWHRGFDPFGVGHLKTIRVTFAPPVSLSMIGALLLSGWILCKHYELFEVMYQNGDQ